MKSKENYPKSHYFRITINIFTFPSVLLCMHIYIYMIFVLNHLTKTIEFVLNTV